MAAIPIFLIGSALFALPLFPSRSGAFFGRSGLEQLALLAGGGGLALAGILMGILGLALYVLIPALSGPGLARRDYGSHKAVLACTALAIVLGNLLAALYFIPVSLVVTGFTARDLTSEMLSPQGLVAAAVALDVSLIGIVYLRVVRPGVIPWSRMGLVKAGLGRRLLLGIFFGVSLLIVSTVLELLMESLGIRQNQAQLFGSVRGAPPIEFLLVLASGAVIAPVVEEIYFRGYVFRAYLDQKGLRRAFLFSAVLFALVHLNIAAFVPILAMGLLLSLFYYRTHSIIPCIVAHAFNNAAAFLLLYLGFQ